MQRLLIISLLVLITLTTGCNSSSSSGSEDNPPGGGDGSYVSDEALDSSITIPAGVSVTGLDGDFGMADADPATLLAYSNCVSACSIDPGLTTPEEQMSCMMDCLDTAGFIDANGAFTVSIGIRNEGSSTETVTMEPGTVLTPDSADYQPMMLIQEIELTLAPGDDEVFRLPVYCLAPSLSAPDSTNSYTIADITDDSCLLNILTILAGKDVDNFDFSDSGTVQDCIWNCIEEDFGPADTAALNALPSL